MSLFAEFIEKLRRFPLDIFCFGALFCVISPGDTSIMRFPMQTQFVGLHKSFATKITAERE